MTQTPQLPPNPSPEPLDAAEREIALALRNLPGGSPPPELDARILGTARRAVHLAQPRKLRWGRSIGIGTAASAVLAVGLFVKMHGSGQDLQVPMSSPASANEMATPAAASRPAGAASASAVARPMELAPPTSMAIRAPTPPKSVPAPVVTQPMEKPAMAVPAPIPTTTAPAERADAGSLAGKAAANAFPAAPPPERGRAQAAGVIEPPPPTPPPVVREEPMQAAAPAPPASAAQSPESKVEAFTAPPRDTENQPAAAAMTAEPGELDKDASQAAKKSEPATGGDATLAGSANAPDAAKAKNLDSVTVTGSRVRRVDTETASPVLLLDRKSLPRLPVEDDASLAPAQWLDRIRARMKAGDDEHARESVRRFHATYPDAAIPGDLRSLLK